MKTLAKPIQALIPMYKVNPDDLIGLNSDTRSAMRPLLEKLNNVIQLLVVAANTPPDVITDMTGFTTNSLGAAYVEIVNPLPANTAPRCVLVAELQRLDGRPIDDVYGFWWKRTQTGILALFVGLAATSTYSYALSVQ